MERCRHAVHQSGRSVGFHQCYRKPVVFVDGIGFCKQHSPEAEKKRREMAQRKHDEAMAALERKNTRYYARTSIIELVKELRDGGWTLTAEMIAKFEKALEAAQ